MNAFARGPLYVLRHRNFRLFWLGFIISNAGSWLQAVAQGWLVYEISGSAMLLGAIGFVRAFPLILLSLVGGAAADRFSKRKILYLAQTVQMGSALILGLVTYWHMVQVWHVILLSALSAAAQAFDQPTRQSLVPTLVAKEDLHAAISLNAIAFNGAAAFGPSLAGILVPYIGLAGCFFLNALSFGTVYLALMFMELPEHAEAPRRAQSMAADLLEGLRYVINRPVILALVSMAAVNSFFARPFQQFITVFAADVFHGDVGLAGLMQSAPAIGTILFMLTVASMREMPHKGRFLVGSGIAFGLSLIAFSWTSSVGLAMALLVLVGGLNMTWQTTLNMLIQEKVGDEMRGRVMSVYTITAVAVMLMGQGPMGWSMARVGPQRALTAGAAISIGWIVLTSLYIGIEAFEAVYSSPSETL